MYGIQIHPLNKPIKKRKAAVKMKISLIYMHPRVVLTGPERKNRGFNVGESSAVLFSSLSFFHALIYAI